MRITIKADQPQAILIGHQGEYGVEEVFIDTSVWETEYGTGVLSLSFTRPDGTQYPVLLTDDTWHISEADNEYDGRGLAQLSYQIPNGRKKSCSFDVYVAKSDSTTPVPDPYDTWLDALQAMAALTQANAQAAEASAEAAATSETNAAASEASASASASAASASETNAATSEANAIESAGSASESASAAATSATNAAASATAAGSSQTAAAGSATQAAASAESAGASATSAGNSASSAQTSATQAAGYATSAAGSATAAAAAETGASGSATAAAGSASAAYTSAQDSEAWAAGQKAGVDVPSTDARYHNNSKYYAQQAAASATAASGSATAAAGSATSAGTSATNAAASATAAQNVLNSIPADYTELVNEVSDLNEDLTDLEKVIPIVDTATGSIASFSDGADNLPLKTLTCEINSVQDLHGYDNPWPAGGGKNLFDKDGITQQKRININTGAIEDTSVDYAISNWISVKSGLAYIWSNPNSSRMWFYDTNKTPVEVITANAYTPQQDGFVLLTIYVTSTPIDTFQFEQGTALSGYTPYSNICPISGHTDVDVTRTGKNLFNKVSVNNIYGSYLNDQCQQVTDGLSTISDYIKCSENTTVTAQLYAMQSNSNLRIFAFDSAKTLIGLISKTFCPTNVTTTVTVTAPEGTAYLRLSGYLTEIINTTYGESPAGKNAMLEFGSTATEYEAYQGQTVTYQLGNTVYGGTLTINDDGSGQIVSTMAMVDLGSLDWVVSLHRFNSTYFLSNAKSGNHADCICSNYVSDTKAATRERDNSVCLANNGYVYIYDTAAEENEVSFKTMMSGVQLVYELATPVTINLTAQEVIDTLKGQNNIWHDANGNTTVEYRADTKLYIDGLETHISNLETQIALIETGTTASKAYTTGQFFFHNNLFCKAKTNIASGATFTLNTNYEVTTVADMLYTALQ